MTTELARSEDNDVQIEVPDAFHIHDAATANWLVRKIVDARIYAKHVKQWAELEIRRAEREEQFFLAHYGQQLEQWARKQISGTRRKSLKLPAGAIGYRNAPSRLDVLDDRKLIAWCRRSLPSALKIETHILRSLVKDHVQKTGECPDGVEIGGGQERFYIR